MLFPRRISLFFAALGLLDLFVLLFFEGGYVPFEVVMVATITSSLVMLIAGTRVSTMYSLKVDQGKSLALLTLASIIYTIGIAMALALLYAGKDIISFGLDDAMFSLALLCLAGSFIFAAKGNKLEWTRVRTLSFLGWGFVNTALLTALFLYASGQKFSTIRVSLGYLIASIILSFVIVFVMSIAWEYRQGTLFYAWAGMSLGMLGVIITSIASILTISYPSTQHQYHAIPLMILSMSQLAFAYGASVVAGIARDIQDRLALQR